MEIQKTLKSQSNLKKNGARGINLTWAYTIKLQSSRRYERKKRVSCSVTPNSSQSHGLQRTRLLYPLSPEVCSDSCPLSWWCHPTISSSVIPLFSCPQSLNSNLKRYSSQIVHSKDLVVTSQELRAKARTPFGQGQPLTARTHKIQSISWPML